MNPAWWIVIISGAFIVWVGWCAAKKPKDKEEK